MKCRFTLILVSFITANVALAANLGLCIVKPEQVRFGSPSLLKNSPQRQPGGILQGQQGTLPK